MDKNLDSKEFEQENETRIQDIPCLCSQRWILGYLGFLFGMVFAIFRADMNIAIVCMAGDVSINVTDYVNISREDAGISDHLQNVTYSAWECEAEYQTRNDVATPTEFTWDRTIQSHVLSAYYYGFVVLQIPSGWFIGRFGWKDVVTIFMSVVSVASMLIPVLARTHVYAALAARAMVGIASAPMPAAWSSLVGKWALSNERSRMMMLFWCGQTTGVAIGFSTSGWLCVHGFDNGWGSIFYVHAFLVASAFLVLSSYMECGQTNIVVLLFCICTFFQSIALSAAYPCNLVDMTPRYASYIYSVSNTIGASSGFIVPLAVAYLTRHKAIEEWQFVFWLTAGVSVFGSVVYGLFSTSEPVSWDKSGPREIVIVVDQKDENRPFIQSTVT